MRSKVIVKRYAIKDKDLHLFILKQIDKKKNYILLPKIRKLLKSQGFDLKKYHDGYYWQPTDEWIFRQWDADDSFLK